jgi:adenine-specific DNA-methyltransferase
MLNNKQKLELTWIGKNNPEYDIANIEPRILEENPKLSNCKNDIDTENMIIHGDNLLALKALLPEYEGRVKCIYIDPPYNTGNAFSTYDDSVEHSTWLSLMKPRLELLKYLLKDGGVICVQIDNSPNSKTSESPEFPYLYILMDEIFGRNNYVSNLIWKKKGNASNTASTIGVLTETIIVFSSKKSDVVINKQQFDKKYKYKDSDGEYNLDLFLKTDSGEYKRDTMKFPIKDKSTGVEYFPPKGMRWTFGKDSIDDFLERGLLVFKGSKVYYKNYKTGDSSKLYNNLLLEHGSLKSAKDEIQSLGFERESFETPKPEILIKEILSIFTNENDLVLDSFLGSGTTAAVAQKMNRRYIGIEMGDHAYTHCKIRLDKVIDGSDQGGISKSVEWKGGGAYKFYELAPSFIIKDEFGNPVIDDFYNDAKLIKAMCKLMNFTYQPSKSEYWKHGIGQGKNYLYVTTQLLTSGMVQQIAQHLTAGESLIICPKKFEPGAEKIDNRITVKKIPQSILKACHFGKKEYLLPVKETAMEEVDNEAEEDDN